MVDHAYPGGRRARGRSQPSGDLLTQGARSSRVVVVRVLLLAGAYGLAARLGLEFVYASHGASLVWPASGIALAAVLLWGRWMAVGIALGAVVASRAGGIALPLALWYGVGNTLSPLLGAWLLQRVGRVHPELDRQRDVLGFVLLGVLLGTLPGPCVGVAGLALVDSLPHAQIGAAWFSWWLGDVAGVLVVAPVVLTWLSADRRSAVGSWRRKLEAVALVLALAVSTLIGVGGRFDWRYAAFLPFPFLIWAALRFGTRGAAAGSLLVSSIAVWATAHGSGPFAAGHVHFGLVQLWVFVGTVVVATLLLAAALAERDRAQHSLENSEERFRRAFEDAPIAMAIASPEGRFQKGNKRMLSLLGYAEGELTKLGVDEVTHPDDRERSREGMRQAREGIADRYGFEKRFLTRDGGVVWANMSTTLLRDSHGQPSAFIGLLEDITARKNAEQEREHLQQQLARSQRLESIGQLAGGVAHDFNNLLLGILLYVDLGLAEASDSLKVREALGEIRAAARRAADLTRQLLAFGRRQTIQPVPLDLDVQIQGLMSLLRRIIPANIDIEHARSGEPCWVMVDPGQIEQVIVNLCVNARDAMPDGGVLRIETSPTRVVEPGPTAPTPGDYVRLRISDTGEGIAPAVRERIFEPFFTTKEQGTGLGLAVIYGIVRQHGGSVDVHSEPGSGTSFEILIPAAEERETASESGQRHRVAGGEETILVVDDEDMPRRLLDRVLGGAGYTVIQARDGVEGVELFEKHRDEVALVILDLIMPRMGGREALSRIRAIDPCAKVVLTTGYAGDALGGVPADVEVLDKPYEADELLRRVRSLLDRARPKRRLQSSGDT